MSRMKKSEYLNMAKDAIRLTVEKADENNQILSDLAALRADNARMRGALVWIIEESNDPHVWAKAKEALIRSNSSPLKRQSVVDDCKCIQ